MKRIYISFLCVCAFFFSCGEQESKEPSLFNLVVQDYRKRLVDEGLLEKSDSSVTLFYNAGLYIVENDTVLEICGGDGYEAYHETVPPLPPDLVGKYVVDSTKLSKLIVKSQLNNNYICLYGLSNVLPVISRWVGNARILPLDTCFEEEPSHRILPVLTCRYKAIARGSIELIYIHKLDCLGEVPY